MKMTDLPSEFLAQTATREKWDKVGKLGTALFPEPSIVGGKRAGSSRHPQDLPELPVDPHLQVETVTPFMLKLRIITASGNKMADLS
ncbi:Hypothetical protein NTJ_14037 [Nesidiocoris tenuis]|uniref:Uncharacterized protein n=1 Tax=Nesidiocoris tenuis TaxID=355587 RepID=A0ABN7BDF9_9HEMI|nr:Hypothetical protein NTJ_14037 [Nesidiocoris tenuis]